VIFFGFSRRSPKPGCCRIADGGARPGRRLVLRTARTGQDEAIDTSGLLATATELRDALAGVSLPLHVHGADEARATADAAVRQLDDYVVPRLRDIDAPVLVVVGGSTGSGKSTLVNSLVGADVTRPGVLRPTTRSPVLVHHPSTGHWFEGDRILGSLARVRGGPGAGPNELELAASEQIPSDLALLDAPDIDSVVDANRHLAEQLLESADLWLFVTTAARYADAVPWEFLRGAARRGAVIGLVLNRIPSGAADEIAPHLSAMVAEEGLRDTVLFTVDEQSLTEGRLPIAAVRPLQDWLSGLADDQKSRAEIVRRNLAGAVEELAGRSETVAVAVDEQRAVTDRLAAQVMSAFDDARRQLTEDVRDGTVLRGEVLARWQDFVGTGELLRQLQSGMGRVRDRIAAAVTGRPTSADRFQGAIETGVESLLRERVTAATERAADAWRNEASGPELLTSADSDLTRPAADLDERAGRLVRDWQAALLELLRDKGAGRRSTARVLSYGVNGVALVLMVGVFAQTGGLTGAEIAIAGGGSAVGQKLLEALLGDQVVRQLAEEARVDLDRRAGELLDQEAARFYAVLNDHAVDFDHAPRLRELAVALRMGVAA
jgi:energy-coupling factor transporter ATP-binding protein EcfA2